MELNLKTVGVESHGVKKTMSFGIGDASVVIDILRNRLYAHPIQALTQEYISNARDAHREVNSNRSIIITVPTILSPVFKVRDFGPGIDPDRYANVFMLYGASTKRSDNVQTGGFGIGAKSAWSYSDSFNVTTFVDGIRRDYVNHVGNKNEGEADLVNESPTDELNGTEIQVPVEPDDIYKFENAVFRATYFWQNECKFMGIEEFELPDRVGMEVEEDIELVKKSDINPLIGINSYSRHLIVSLDGIPYPVEGYEDENISHLMAMLNDEYTAVIHLSTGDVSVAASRDAISYDDDTIETLKLAVTNVIESFNRYINRKIDDVDSVSKFFHTYRELTSEFKSDKLDLLIPEYGEYKIKSWSVCSNLFKKLDISEVSYKFNRRKCTTNLSRLDWQRIERVRVKHLDSQIYYVDVAESQTKISRRIKTILSTTLKHKLTSERNITLLKACPENMEVLLEVATDLKAIPLSTIDMEAIERRPSMKDRGEVVLHVFRDNSQFKNSRTRCRITLDENETTYVYVKLENSQFPEIFNCGHEFANWMNSLDDNIDFCGVSKQALKIIGNDENFIPFEKWFDEFKITAKMKSSTITHKIGYDTSKVMRQADKLHKLNIKDSEFTTLAQDLTKLLPNSKTVMCLPKVIQDLIEFNGDEEVAKVVDKAEKFRTMMDNYPLFSIIGGIHNDYDFIDKTMMNELEIYMDSKKESLTKIEE